jgi:hypothetical protein
MARASSGRTTLAAGFSWARAVFCPWGVDQEKDKKARENPKMAPIRTRLKMSKFLEDSFCKTFIFYAPDLCIIVRFSQNSGFEKATLNLLY